MRLRDWRWLFLKLACSWFTIFFFLSGSAHGQVLNVDQQVEVQDLPSLLAPTAHGSDVLITSLATIIHDPEVCCAKNSALEDDVQRADPKSLKDVAGKLDGRHLLSDGRPIMVTAEFLVPEAVNSGHLLTMMSNQHAPLMQWNSHIYVVHGVIYRWTSTGGPEAYGSPITVIHKFLLWDSRYSDSRREVVFDRQTDDISKVQGLLFVQTKLQ